MKYKNKRVVARLGAYSVAKRLGVSLDKYKDIEEGRIPLEGEYLDKFLDIINNAKDIRTEDNITRLNIQTQAKYGELKKLMRKRGYNVHQLAKALNLSYHSINKVIEGKDTKYDTCGLVYDFLKNPINKNLNNDTKQEVKKEMESEGNMDYKKIMIEKGLKVKDIAKAVGCTTETVYALFRGIATSGKKVNKVIDYIMNYEPKTDEMIIKPDMVTIDKEHIDIEPSGVIEVESPKEAVNELENAKYIEEPKDDTKEETSNEFNFNIGDLSGTFRVECREKTPEDYEEIIDELVNEIKKYERQVERYEKLIDLIPKKKK